MCKFKKRIINIDDRSVSVCGACVWCVGVCVLAWRRDTNEIVKLPHCSWGSVSGKCWLLCRCLPIFTQFSPVPIFLKQSHFDPIHPSMLRRIKCYFLAWMTLLYPSCYLDNLWKMELETLCNGAKTLFFSVLFQGPAAERPVLSVFNPVFFLTLQVVIVTNYPSVPLLQFPCQHKEIKHFWKNLWPFLFSPINK